MATFVHQIKNMLVCFRSIASTNCLCFTIDVLSRAISMYAYKCIQVLLLLPWSTLACHGIATVTNMAWWKSGWGLGNAFGRTHLFPECSCCLNIQMPTDECLLKVRPSNLPQALQVGETIVFCITNCLPMLRLMSAGKSVLAKTSMDFRLFFPKLIYIIFDFAFT